MKIKTIELNRIDVPATGIAKDESVTKTLCESCSDSRLRHKQHLEQKHSGQCHQNGASLNCELKIPVRIQIKVLPPK